MACGASVASASVVSKDSIFDRVMREEEDRMKAMGMGGRDYSPDDGRGGRVRGGTTAGGGVVGKKDKMRGGRRVEI